MNGHLVKASRMTARTNRPVTKRSSPIDQRPFRSKADHERELPLEAHYRNIGIRCVAAAKTAARPVSENRPHGGSR